MPRYICKLEDEGTGETFYLEWSTVVDAPVTNGASLDEFKDYYRRQYGEDGMNGLDERLLRVEAKGTSSILDKSARDLIRGNRAGDDESELTYEQIIERYCRNVPA